MPKPSGAPGSIPVQPETGQESARLTGAHARTVWFLRKCLRFVLIALTVVAIGAVLVYLRGGPFWLSRMEILCGKPATLEAVYTYSDLTHGFSTEGPWFNVLSFPADYFGNRHQDLERLRRYPKYGIWGDDGETSFRWKHLRELSRTESAVLDDMLTRGKWGNAAENDPRIAHIHALLAERADSDDILVTAWYKNSGGYFSDIRMYVLSMRDGLLFEIGFST